MEKKPSWTFVRRGKKDPQVGDYLPGKILQSRKLNPIAVYTREGGQNTLNQPKDDNPVNVEVKLIELTGRVLEEYLENLHWNDLKNHIKACASSSSQSSLARTLKESLKEIDEKNSLFILNIEDSNSFGLTGPEGTEESADRPNFFNLCKATFSTSENAKSSRGGSYGVGKSIFWTCSKLSTVLFSSFVEKTKENPSGLRLYGRSELSSHKEKDTYFMGTGFFGERKKNKEDDGYTYDSGDSIWDDYELAKKLYLDRDKNKGTGATISIVGFKEDLYENGVEGHEILEGIKNQFEKYFWPSLSLSPNKLNLSFIYQRNNRIINDYDDLFKIDLSKWQHFIDAAKTDKDNIDKIANTANSMSCKKLSLKIPQRKIPIDELKEKVKGDVNTPFQISIKRGDRNSINHEESNRIALIRGFGMVVEYKQPGASSIGSSLPYFGVVKVGCLLGSSDQNVISEVFFKDLEPALHDRWDSKTVGLETRYKNAKNTVDDFYEQIDENLLEMLGEEELDNKKGPELLSEMLSLGFKGKKESGHNISSENIKAVIIGKYEWSVSGTIKISDFPKKQDEKNKNSWDVGFGFSIKEETSRGDKVPFSEIKFNESFVELIDSTKEAKVKITDNKKFSFQGKINLEKIVGNQNPKFFAINFYTTN